MHCLSPALTLLLKRKHLSSHMKGSSSLPIILKIKRSLSHIYKTKISHFLLLKQMWHAITSKKQIILLLVSEILAHYLTANWFKRMSNNYSVIFLQHSMASGNHTADHPPKETFDVHESQQSASIKRLPFSSVCLFHFVVYTPHFQLRARRWMDK